MVVNSIRAVMIVLALVASSMATVFYSAGGAPAVAQFTLQGEQIYVTAYGFDNSRNLEVLLEDLSTDGLGLRFKLDLITPAVSWTSPQVGSWVVTVPAANLQTTPLQFKIGDLIGGFPQCAPGVCAQDQGRLPQSFRLTIRQPDEVQTPIQLEVKTKDHLLGNPQIYVLSAHVINKDATRSISDFVLRYYFTVESTSNQPLMMDYYSPIEKVCLRRSVQHPKDYVMDLNFLGTQLLPGASTLGAVENQIHINYAGYTMINKGNDWSNPIPAAEFVYPWNTLFKVNSKAVVLNGARTEVLYGEVNPVTVGDTWTNYAGECN